MFPKTSPTVYVVLSLIFACPVVFGYTGQGQFNITTGQPTIDGIIGTGEWDSATWIDMDTVYTGSVPDLSEAKWAAMWSPGTNLVYVVITGTDTDHIFSSSFIEWNEHDDVEIHIDAGNTDVTDYAYYRDTMRYAQHYFIGPNGSGGEWSAILGSSADAVIPGGYAVTVNGNVITYEFALTPYTDLNLANPAGSPVRTLQAGDVIGLDMIMSTKQTDGGFGMLCENAVMSKFSNASALLDHTLVEAVLTAGNESPTDGQTVLDPNVVLSWTAGGYAAWHDVYFGTDYNDVNDANASDSTGIYRGRQNLNATTYDTNDYDANGLEAYRTYYWRIDEVNEADPCSPWKGDVWQFTVGCNMTIEGPFDFLALAAFTQRWLDEGYSCCAADLDHSGNVDFADFALLAQDWYLPGDYNSPYAQWSNGPPTDIGYFPIGVWLQRPEDATLWQNAGVNLYIGLWAGPTEAQLTTLLSAGMQVIASQNSTALAWKNVTLANGRPLIIGYNQQDEPDNCQSDGQGGWGPPVPTSTIQSYYSQIIANDPTRPVWLNLSQGVGWDNATWPGQGGYIDPDVDYPQYILGSDIVSFDIYPMNCGRVETCGDAWRVALGVDRLHQYSPDGHIVWNFIETGDISANDIMVTPEEIRTEVWMSVIHGSTGICYFIHGKTLDPPSDFRDRALLEPEHAEQLAAVTAINNRLRQLAPVINSPTLEGVATVEDVVGNTPVDFIVKQYGGATYLFAAGMRDSATVKLFTLTGLADTTIEVIDEGREMLLIDGQFPDEFDGYEAHLYKINAIQ